MYKHTTLPYFCLASGEYGFGGLSYVSGFGAFKDSTLLAKRAKAPKPETLYKFLRPHRF